VNDYSARQGDIIWLDFDPQAGHEQKGRRPAVVISNNLANRLLNTRAIVCPISSTNKGIPIQPELDNRTSTRGVILCDQVRTVDLVARKAIFIESMPFDLLQETIDIVYGLVEFLRG
jgi:mRNA interferase MazF